jgi:uncharacterized integral membrane protein (TIGR00698 family)
MVGLGIAVAFIGALIARAVHQQVDWLSPLVVAVVLGSIIANVVPPRPAMRRGLAWTARHVLRLGIVLVGLRLSLSDVAELGPRALVAVCLVVTATFVGTQWLGRRLGLSPGLSMLVAVGYSICGASAIAAAEPFSDATEEEVAYSIALVTLCGTLAIAVLPAIGSLLGLGDHQFGSWVGASVHDVGQVVATASIRNDIALQAAVVVKLTRVVLLAPLLAMIAVRHRRARGAGVGAADVANVKRPPLLPWFVALFMVAVVVRTTGVMPKVWLGRAKNLETLLLSMGLVGLGTGVRVSKLRVLGGRPLLLGLASWVLVGAVSFGAVAIAL